MQIARRHERAKLDFASGRTQLFCSALIIIAACFALYLPSLTSDFLLDDYLHLDYCARFLRGDVGPFLQNLWGNWGGSDLMKSYRPVISLTIMLDYLLYHTDARGYHFANILWLAAVSVMVSILAFQLASLTIPRSAGIAALWAGLLFAFYPLHVESTAWIIGRVDTVATFFYLLSLSLFLRYRLHGERKILHRSLFFFAISLASKEIAVSLPVAVFLCALLTSDKSGGARLKQALRAALPYIGLLAAFALFRQLILGTTIGGYGGNSPRAVLSHLRNFADRDSLLKIIVPVSEEYRHLAQVMKTALLPLVCLFAVATANLLAECKYRILLLPVWAAAALAPAFQIWHIYPNLVGSRLFFLSSAPLAIFLALSVYAVQRGSWRRVRLILATLSCLALCLVWSAFVKTNLKAWVEAGSEMRGLSRSVREAAAKGQGAVFLNLPQDHKGAGLIGRKIYLDIMLDRPFVGENLSARAALVARSGAYYEAKSLASALSGARPLYYLVDGQCSPLVAAPAKTESRTSVFVENGKIISALPDSLWRKRGDGDCDVAKTADGYLVRTRAHEVIYITDIRTPPLQSLTSPTADRRVRVRVHEGAPQLVLIDDLGGKVLNLGTGETTSIARLADLDPTMVYRVGLAFAPGSEYKFESVEEVVLK